MRDVHQGGAVSTCQAGQHVQQRIPALLVHHARDLVGDKERRLAGQRRGEREALQFAAGQASGLAFAQAVQADLAEQMIDVDGRTRRQSPHHIVGDPGSQDLAFRVLQYDRGAA